MKPTIGRVVIYKTTEEDKDYFRSLTQKWQTINVSDQLPAMIVAVWSDTCINVQVMLDGVQSTMWKTSVNQGDVEGQWSWPIIEHKQGVERTPVAKLPDTMIE